MRSSLGKSLLKVGKEFLKSNGRELEGKVVNKGGKFLVRVLMKDDVKLFVKLLSKE